MPGRFHLASRSSLVCIGLLLSVSTNTHAHAADAKAQRWALLIGVNDYANVQHLRYCVADQEALAKQLTSSGFPTDQVYVLDDNAKEQKFRPSKLNIERQLDLVLGMPSPGDTVVVSFSGHGVDLEKKSYICPADCDLEHPRDSMIALEKVYDALFNCKASLKLLIVDACRNEVELGGKRSFDDARGLRALSIDKPPEGISLLTSCSPGQFAREHDKLGHGVFMHFVLKGLAGEAADKDGVVRLFGLLNYTSLETQKYVHDQFNAAQRPYYRVEGSGPVELASIDRASGSRIDLASKYKKGDKRSASMTVDGTTTLFDGKTTQTLSRTSSNTELHFEVLSIDRANTKTLRLGMDRVSIKQETAGAKEEFDTERPATDADKANAKAVKNTQITLTIDAAGKAHGDAAAFQNALVKNGADANFAKLTAEGFVNSITKGNGLNAFSGVTPGKPVGIGDSWTQVDTYDDAVRYQMNCKFTLQDRREGTAIMRVEGTAKMDLKQPDVPELTGPVRGTVEVNESNGWLTRYDVNSVVSAKVENRSITIRSRVTLVGE